MFLHWTCARASLHAGWWLVTGVYLVVDARLSPSQLVVIGVAQSLVGLVCEIPAGVVADTVSRRWSLIVSQLLMGTAMLATGLTASFGALVGTQMLWGLSWTFASGADVAWITGELAAPKLIPKVLARAARMQLTGAAAGIVSLGVLASLIPRNTTMVLAGSAMVLLAGYVAVRFRERGFVPVPARRWAASWSIFRAGARLVHRNRIIMLMSAATFLVSGAGDAYARLHLRRLLDLGFPADRLLWFTALGMLSLLVGAVTLRAVERLVGQPRLARRGYLVACAAGALGMAGLAVAADEPTAAASVLLVGGVALPLTRTIRTVRVNQETTDTVRATVHSFLAQAEYLGEIVCGAAFAVLARFGGLSPTFAVCAVIYVAALLLVQRRA